MRLSLEALITQESSRRLAALGGGNPRASSPPRHRARTNPGRYLDLDRPSAPLRSRAVRAPEPGAGAYPSDDHRRAGARSLRDRKTILGLPSDLANTPLATHAEVLLFVELNAWYGVGLSMVDAHLLAALRLSSPDRLWTRDRRLRLAADKLGVSADLPA